MAEQSAISWTDATFNGWMGCSKVGPGCDHCYALDLVEGRFKRAKWGPGEPRMRTSAANWNKPKRWPAGTRVFCSSLADVFDNEVPQEWRDDLFALIRETPHLRWMLLTKRIGNAPKMLPADWPFGFDHVGLMATLVNQEEFDRDYGRLIAIPAAWHGISAEPLLGPIDMRGARPSWVITGGESGPHHRAINPAWVRSLRDQCERSGIAFHHKQWGGSRPKQNGCELDGREHKAFPMALT